MNRIRIHVLPTSRGRLTPLPRLQDPPACAFAHRPCARARLEGQDFCLNHILEDRGAPFKQCGYVSLRTGRRCPGAAPKPEKKDGVAHCAEHARKNALAARLPSRRSSAGPSPEALLAQLSGYVKGDAGCVAADSSRCEASRIL
ncbi:hypothetical protein scyTo_0027389, partial [Scyliorhinus torazame]|nr:hypothetical protein [Scyliorhinus torazame]